MPSRYLHSHPKQKWTVAATVQRSLDAQEPSRAASTADSFQLRNPACCQSGEEASPLSGVDSCDFEDLIFPCGNPMQTVQR